MPKQKDLKRLVRARMAKTGESYTTARAQILRKNATGDERPSAGSEPTAHELGVDLAARAGTSEKAVLEATGRSWRDWVEILDAVDATSLPHREIARHVLEEHGTTHWWSQSVAVGYERIRGLREIGQRPDGSYEANKSKTFPAPIARVYRAFSVARERNRWLPGVDLTVRKENPHKSIRITWPDGTPVTVYFVAKGEAKTQVAIQHGGLASRDEVAEHKELWAGRLAALAELLA